MSDELNEVWELYAEEGNSSLDEAEGILLKLQDGASDPAAIAALFRALHTFKGNARVMGLSVIESRAHLAEDLIGLVRDEGVPLDESLVDLLLETLDILRGMLEDSLHDRSDVKPEPSESLAGRLKHEHASRRQDLATPGAPVSPIPSSEPEIPLPPDDGQPEHPPVSSSDLQREELTEASIEEDTEISAILFDDDEPSCLADDPLYRQIFADMAFRFLEGLSTGLSAYQDDALTVTAQLAEDAERLQHAANQMGLMAWNAALGEYLALDFPTETEIRAALERFTARALQDFAEFAPLAETTALPGTPVAETFYADSALEFFTRLQIPLEMLANLGACLKTGQPVAREILLDTLQEILTVCTRQGFPGPGALIEEYLATLTPGDIDAERFEDMEFALFESLAALQQLSLTSTSNLPVDAIAILRLSCAERMEDHLMEIGSALDKLDQSGELTTTCSRLKRHLWRIYHACQHYRIPVADELCMALLDLYERIHAGETRMGSALTELTRTFVLHLDRILLTFTEDHPPDDSTLKQLRQEAGEINFTLTQTHTPVNMETTLGLPSDFHKVITPESVIRAEAAITRGDNFYILRVDLNSREELAASFLEWLQSGVAETISNVTVLDGDRSLFDFLVATPLDREPLQAALQSLDPTGESLQIQKLLYPESTAFPEATPVAAPEAVSGEDMPDTAARDYNASDLLEYIGELVTTQSVVAHLLSELEKQDWTRTLDAEVAAAGGEWHRARETIRQRIDDWQDKLEQLLQVESRVSALLDSLQESAIAMRTLSAGQLLNPLVPWLETLAHTHQRPIKLIVEGEKQNIDQHLLERLEPPLRALLTFSALQSIESPAERAVTGKPPEAWIRLALAKTEDHLQVTLQDDGRGILPMQIAARMQQMERQDMEPFLDAVMIEGFGPIRNSDHETGQLDFGVLRDNLRIHGGDLHLMPGDNGGLFSCITMPQAMVVMVGMVVKVGEIQYVIPIDSIQRIIHSGDDVITHLSADQGRKVLRLPNGHLLSVQYLLRNGSRLDDKNEADTEDLSSAEDKTVDRRLFVVVGNTEKQVAVSVDELIGQQQLLIRPLQGYLSRIRGVMGCALLGSGGVGLVLNIDYVITHEMPE